ncbi:MAG: hypothetical protein KDB80_09815 [Planctomycetes bacterium]|nr:hypothetical protein [Planctomycetota bacterium]
MSTASAGWQGFVTRALTDGSVAFVLVTGLWWLTRRWISVRVAYALFAVVLLKMVSPISFAGPTWLAWLSPATWGAHPPIESTPVALQPLFVVASPAEPVAMTTVAWLFVGWIVVVTGLLVRFGLGQWRLAGIVRAARPVRRGEFGLDLADLARIAGVRRRVRWLVTDAVESPATGGIVRPFVLLPRGLNDAIPTVALRWVLLHELAHVRRGDVLVSFAQRLVQIGLFFHPLVWWTNRLIDEQREFACDEAALAASGARRKECGEGFLSVVEWARARGVRGPAGAMAMFDEKSAIRRRLMNIIERPRRTSRFQRVVLGVFALTVAGIVLPTARLEASATTGVAMQDPGKRAEDERELQRLQRRLERLQQRQAELLREIEAYRRADAGTKRGTQRFRGGIIVSGPEAEGVANAPTSGRVIVLDDVTDAIQETEEVAVGEVAEVAEVIEILEDVTDSPAIPHRVHVRKRVETAPEATGGTFVEIVEEAPEPSAGHGESNERAPRAVVIRSRQGVSVSGGKGVAGVPTQRGQAVIRSQGKTQVIDLDGMPSSGVIEIGGESIRYERQTAGPKPPTKRAAKPERIERVIVTPPKAVDAPPPAQKPAPRPISRLRRAIYDQ